MCEIKPELHDRIRQFFECRKKQGENEENNDFLRVSSPHEISRLEDMFMKTISFGTAGFRGVMEPGFNRINSVTVMQISQAIALNLLDTHGKEACQIQGVVIGFDSRHNSEFFAHLAASVFLSKNFKVYLTSQYIPTPFIPFAVVQYQCLVGCQITASHNPKIYNGYKIYNHHGAQVVPPMETEIERYLAKDMEPWTEACQLVDFTTKKLKDLSQVIDPYASLVQEYMKSLSDEFPHDEENFTTQLTTPIVYTPLHGVGGSAVYENLKHFHYDLHMIHSVEEQFKPDPEFPTVTFPNPEEAGALDMAKDLARQKGIKIILANDPDADRFACLEMQKDGSFKSFTGDEIGIIFAHENFLRLQRRGVPKEKIFFVCSIVSSRMLKTLAQVEGCRYEETMTGFKWMMNKGIELKKQGLNLGLVYEEALGFTLHPNIPDKDGISSVIFCMQLLSKLQKENITLTEYLENLKKKYGYFVTKNSYFTYQKLEQVALLFERFRNNGHYQSAIGQYKLKRIRDITTGYDNGLPGNVSLFPKTPSQENITLFFDNGTTITFRCSGTEPKLKYYAEVCGTSEKEAEELLQRMVKETTAELIQPDRYGLVHA